MLYYSQSEEQLKKRGMVVVLLVLTGTFCLFANAQTEVQTTVPEMQNSVPERDTSLLNQEQLHGAMAAEAMDTFTPEQMLQYAIEDERMALSEYELIMRKFDISQPFSHIIEAEKQHERLLLDLYQKYGFTVPSFVGSDHVIIPESLSDTYQVGIEAEIKNIDMYNKFLTYPLNDDVREVFTELRDGSINHLAAFKKQAEKE